LALADITTTRAFFFEDVPGIMEHCANVSICGEKKRELSRMMQMIDSVRLSRDDLLDALFDLKHDLGKYIRLPVAMLPADSTAADLRQALGRALLKTRQGPRGDRPAREIWTAFTEEVGRAVDERETAGQLRRAVERALGWERALADDDDTPLDRAALEADLTAVSRCIQALIEEVSANE
jgi:hypothetical protein